MKHHIDWPDSRDSWPVFIKVGMSVDRILQQGYLTAQVKASHVQIMGVMLDADDHSAGRYQRLRQLLLPLFPSLPESMPAGGLITDNDDLKRLGIWLMPDNKSEGCMELFLRFLVPNTSEEIWQHAVESVRVSRKMGAPCRDSHVPKAELFTWLAWQDPPGYSPGIALTKKILDPHSADAEAFVTWFKELFSLGRV